MKNKSSSIPLAVLIKKFYCHKCGERLKRNPITRTIKRGDPEYRKHSRRGHSHVIGDIELTEYSFICPSCNQIVEYDEQLIIDRIQKNVSRHVVSQTEIDENIESATKSLKRKRKITNIIVGTFIVALVIFVFYMWLRSGDFSFKVYL